ncbi:hypothetical protein PHJA_002475500 [Phtheirospermum japonicum]|uniref:Uncharacterized protein n=1 Tax=Phtheirospermum japonicum TaxID=374723 RepID=A0A830CVT9_9LAMI|nr:hypothetical protein PHJA_002475500 [Phtheirospermum japonicum]
MDPGTQGLGLELEVEPPAIVDHRLHLQLVVRCRPYWNRGVCLVRPWRRMEIAGLRGEENRTPVTAFGIVASTAQGLPHYRCRFTVAAFPSTEGTWMIEEKWRRR